MYFRVVRSEEDVRAGLSPKDANKNVTMQRHVVNASRYGDNWISMTKSVEIMLKWGCADGSRAVAINEELAVGVSFTDISSGYYFPKNHKSANNFARASAEVLADAAIPASAITLIFTQGKVTEEDRTLVYYAAQECRMGAEYLSRADLSGVASKATFDGLVMLFERYCAKHGSQDPETLSAIGRIATTVFAHSPEGRKFIAKHKLVCSL